MRAAVSIGNPIGAQRRMTGTVNGTTAYHSIPVALRGGGVGTVSAARPENTATLRGLKDCKTVISADEAIRAALPAGRVTDDDDFGMTVFNLARHLKAVPRLLDMPTAEL